MWSFQKKIPTWCSFSLTVSIDMPVSWKCRESKWWTEIKFHQCSAPQCVPLFGSVEELQGGPKKQGHRLMTIILSILNRFKKFLHWKIPTLYMTLVLVKACSVHHVTLALYPTLSALAGVWLRSSDDCNNFLLFLKLKCCSSFTLVDWAWLLNVTSVLQSVTFHSFAKAGSFQCAAAAEWWLKLSELGETRPQCVS